MTLAPLERVVVYIHLPLCRARCDYCDLFTHVGVSVERQQRLVDAVAEQAAHTLRALGYPRIDTLYIGGGTPSSLAPAPLARLLATVRTLLRWAPTDAEVTFEANPEDLRRDLLLQLMHSGVTRLSVGVQSSIASLLRHIGRRYDARRTAAGVDALTRWWGGGLNLDLIAAVDYSASHDVERDARFVAAASADHVSLYELNVEPHTRLALRRRRAGVVRDESYETRALEHLDAVRTRLHRYGFVQYEVSNYAIPGFESRYNRACRRGDALLGLGPGAVGTLPTTQGPIRTTGFRALDTYLGSDPLWRWSADRLTPLELGEELFMRGLRTSAGVPLRRIRDLLGQGVETLLPTTLQRYAPVIRIDRDSVRLNRRGWNVLDTVLVGLFDELAARIDHEQEVRWPVA